ncbi:hypothetical protein BJY59DRAFT_705435 [Rhodotorula toruloides]
MSQTYKLNEKRTVAHTLTGGRYRLQATAFAAAGFPLVFTLSYDDDAELYKLDWRSASGPLLISRCVIKVEYDGYKAFANTLEGMYLPEAQVASIFAQSPRSSYSQETYTFDVELHCAPGSLQPREEVEAAKRQLQLARTTFIETERKTFAKHATGKFDGPYAAAEAVLTIQHAESITAQVPQDVALVFPSSQRVLWATAKALTQASPYLKELLESDFIEGSAQTSFDAAFETAGLVGSGFDDSDDENDTRDVAAAPASNREPKAPFKLVRIAQTSYTTYAAVLVWISSHHIAFAPLRSTSRSEELSKDLAVQACAASRDSSIAKDANLPAPASPKSVYRLAHLLRLDALAALALENLKSQLTPKNASYELYSDVACCYPAVRDVVLAYVVEHWNEVGKSKAASEMQDKAEQGELPVGAAKTAMMLAAKLAERQK